ncbi:transposable element gene [Prunus dulcis]|uniref:Transposable element protein n=1 Tax=Prunus dulcis TaxID=3755 RepID=A0A4Y1QRC5_PRUDU|nr:transposable element gene [Prunus dulcis]
MRTPSLDNNKYFILFIDDWTRMTWEKNIYTSKEFNKFCEDEGVEHQLTIGYAPKQKGVLEIKNRTVMEMARSMIFEKGLPNTF